jgi:putative ABC transport system permease protein
VLRQTVRGLLARKLRVLLTAVAVVLGVGLLSGTLVLGDTTKAELEEALAGATEGIDVQVRPRREAPLAEGPRGSAPPLTTSLVERIAQVEGVAAASGSVDGYAQLLGRDGRPLGGGEPLGRSVGPSLAADLTAGRMPRGETEVVVDRSSADRERYRVGDQVQVVTAGGEPQPFTVAGILDAEQFRGVALAGFDLPTAQRLFNREGELDRVDVEAAAGVDQRLLRDQIAATLGADVEAVTGSFLADEQAGDLQDELGSVSTLVVLFGLVALLIGAFIINNTFSILVAQRTRELALLRCLGASRKQLRNSVLLESLLVGAAASAAGLLFGIAVASALRALLVSTSGLRDLGSLSRHAPVIAPRTALVALAAGTVVTVLSALAPARRATRVPPVVALREELTGPDRHQTKVRTALGMLLGLAGVGVVLAGIFGPEGSGEPQGGAPDGPGAGVYVGGGAVLLLIGLRLAGPLLAGRLARLVGLPIARGLQLPGELARQNAMRNPRRTAATALALTIGVGLLSLVTILAASTKAAAVAEFDRSYSPEYELRVGGDGRAGGNGGKAMPPPIGPEIAASLAALPELAGVAAIQFTQDATVAGGPDAVLAVDPATVQQVIAVDVRQGSLADLTSGAIAVSGRQAAAHGWRVGASVPVQLPHGTGRFTVRAVYDSDLIDGLLLTPGDYRRLTHDRSLQSVYLRAADGVPPGDARAAIDRALAGYPTVQVLDRAERRRQVAGQIDPALRMYLALIGLAIVIGLFGIVNTMALSVFERVRELGLLRAVGMDRRQVRSMVRGEAVIITVIGAVLGLAVGSFLGWALTRALEDSSSPTLFTLPAGWLALFAVLAALAGVVAAALPARRAGRVDLLRAIAAE